MILLLTFTPAVFAADTPSSWAAQEIEAAMDADLVPRVLQGNYQAPVSRGNVAELFVRLLTYCSGKSIDQLMAEKGVSPDPSAFTDTQDPNVLACNVLGIIKGVGGHRFDPSATLQRAQIAAIINRVARTLGEDTEGYTHSFTDVAGHWCDSELGWPVANGIIKGVGGGKFDPNGPLSVEQAIVISYRSVLPLYQARPEPVFGDYTYVLNTGSHEFHNAWCEIAKTIPAEDSVFSGRGRDEIMEDGYTPCPLCRP